MKLLGLTLPTQVPLGAWFLAPVMYTGTLYVDILDRRSHIYQHAEDGGTFRYIFTTWIGFRNIIAVREVLLLYFVNLTCSKGPNH
jgi:hypothetical protein